MSIDRQAKILTDKQQANTLRFIETTRYPIRNRVIFLLSFKAGLRAKEIASITWSMVCYADGYVGDVIHLENKATKGKYSGRIIPMNKELQSALMDLFAIQQNENFSLSDRVIQTERANHTSAQAIVNQFRFLYKDLGLVGCSSHSGRRTFITNAAKNVGQVGGTLNDVRMLAGHSTLATTQRYIAYNTDAHRKLVELV